MKLNIRFVKNKDSIEWWNDAKTIYGWNWVNPQNNKFFITFGVATLTLGSWPRQGLANGQAKYEAWESHFMLPIVQKSGKEWTFILKLQSELSLWELES
jgi:hypothetical protein